MCAISLRFATDYPVVPIALGASIALTAFGAYISTGSPRWKGAPSLFGHKSSSMCVHHGDASRLGVTSGVCTSTKTPWATSKEDDDAQQHQQLIIEEGDLKLLTDGEHHNFLQLPDHGPHRQKYRNHMDPLPPLSHPCSENAAVYEFCYPAAPTRAAVSFTSGVASSYCLHRSWNGYFSSSRSSSSSSTSGSGSRSSSSRSNNSSRSSGANTPTALLSSCASRQGVSVLDPRDTIRSPQSVFAGDSHLSGFDWNPMSPVASMPSARAGDACEISEGVSISEASSVIPPGRNRDSLAVAKGCSSHCCLVPPGASVSRTRRYDWRRHFGDSVNVTGGRLQQTLSHLVGAVAVSHTPCAGTTEDEAECEEGWPGPRLSPSLIPIPHDTDGAADHDTLLASHDHGAVESADNNDVASNWSDSHAAPELVATPSEVRGEDRQATLSRPAQLEAQLRILETRLEQQLRDSMEHFVSVNPTQKQSTEPDAPAPPRDGRRCGSADAPQVGGKTTAPLNLCDTPLQPCRTPAAEGIHKETASTPNHQHDRRVDDVFVHHRGDGVASYSLSLTYHDAHGSSRTIDTHPLPPLVFSPRSTVTTPGSAVVTDASGSCWQTPSSLSLQDGVQSLSRPLTTSWHGGARGSSKELAAPLPSLESVTGPRLQGVAGKRGELRIGAFLGGGWCGKVYECLNTETGEFLAAKQLVYDSKDPKLPYRLKQLELELEVLTVATHHRMPWIVGFHGAEKHGHSVLMYLEYCSNGSLLDYMTSHGIAVPVAPSSRPPSVALPGMGTCVERNSTQMPVCGGVSQNKHQDKHKNQPSSTREGDSDAEKQPFCAPSCFLSAADHLQKSGAFPEMPFLAMEEVQHFTWQTVEALHFLHTHGYAHLDVKTANILVTQDGDARLADFGCCMRLKACAVPRCSCEALRQKGEMTTCNCAALGERCDAAAPTYPVLMEDEPITELRGTALYMAPEMIRFECERIGTAGDVWSLGCVVMELATGAAPWRHVARDKLRVLFRIGSSREELPLPPSIVYAAGEARRWLASQSDSTMETCTHPPPSHDDDDDAAAAEVVGGEWRKRRRVEHTTSEVDTDVGAAHFLAVDRSSWEACRQRMLLFVALENFLSLCLRIRPEDRPSCEDLLHHPFLTIG
ncbi:protein kinase [Trypanosoma grayi]|uniref:protein kinase n=1 Tax=Trypanosoma grayi TaxID=71804 RepID=UPI0004F48FD8|nr:protein kinase [Trypanosoma grayi]KEG14996.1 protein kinase [Trypanosoma grayi]